jgi:hypothetical protein
MKREDNVKVKKFPKPVLRTCNFESKIMFYWFYNRTNFTTKPKIIHNQKLVLNWFWNMFIYRTQKLVVAFDFNSKF